MKFIKLTTGHTLNQLNSIFDCQVEANNNLEELQSLTKFVTFTNEFGLECMFLFGEEDIINQIFENFNILNINFFSKDITEDILKGNLPRLEDKHTDAMLRIMMNEFLDQNQTIDNILDKISESGIESLNNYDKSILENK